VTDGDRAKESDRDRGIDVRTWIQILNKAFTGVSPTQLFCFSVVERAKIYRDEQENLASRI
jgi:hypothetical protein